MKNSLKSLQLIGFIFACIAGVLLHYVFVWSGGNIIVACFSPINESIWEHAKLIFFSMLIFAFIENHITKHRIRNFWRIKLAGIGLGTLLVPMLYYTYVYGLGITAGWFNIIAYFIEAAIVMLVETALFINCNSCGYSRDPSEASATSFSERGALVIFFIIIFVFALFTFMPPELPLFKDMVTGTYGFFARI